MLELVRDSGSNTRTQEIMETGEATASGLWMCAAVGMRQMCVCNWQEKGLGLELQEGERGEREHTVLEVTT